MDSYTLRRATSADAAVIAEISRAAYAQWVPVIGREPLPMAADYAHAVLAHHIELYEVGGQTRALLEVIAKPDHLLIENIAVRPELQGQGIGDLLVKHADTLARALNLRELRLYTNAAFASNMAFYGRRGFSEFRREQYPSGGVVVHMKKLLAP